ncbi:F-box only protein 21-like [Cataglyphis hispanica]|uniref:F-box only protein 21-like n=1 Tax=Cataglyphis hispanica TaxID=1086592 RepID=UPI00217FFA1B|nr:F-box only protein 21-like [Cataglyphis hispanica]
MEKKFSQRWPSAKKIYDKQCKKNKQEKCRKCGQKSTKDFIKTGINCVRQLQNCISHILHEHYHNNEAIDNLIEFHRIFNLDKCFIYNIINIIYEEGENFITCSVFIDEFKNLLTQSSRRTDCDLTERYCQIKMFHFMRQCLVRKKLYRYTDQCYKNQLLERIVTMAAQWLQPEKDIFYSKVKASLDNIALEVLDCLREKYPNHSICSTPAFSEFFSYWKENNIEDNYWDEEEGTQIIETLREYMFDEFQLTEWGMSSNTTLEYMCIDNVLEKRYGEELILLVIYHSVARRLGLRCDVVRSSSHFFLSWKPYYFMNNSRNGRFFNISSKSYIPHRTNFIYFDELRASRFWQELIYSTLENSNLYNDTFGIMSDGSIQLIRYDRINVERRRINVLSLSVKKTKRHTRPKDVKFAVGMIVTHQPADCVGVIIGWHQHLDRHIVEFSAKNVPNSYMHLCELPLYHCRNCNFKKEQTNYIILTENNKMCYVEEDAITLTTPRWIDNSEIGRYFYKFEGTHYVPNKMLARFYPQDAALTAQQDYNNITITSQHCDNIDTFLHIEYFSLYFLICFFILQFNLYL